MERKNVLFICRYSLANVDSSINYSVNRKVSGILSLFQIRGYTTWVLKTSDFNSYRKPNRKIIRVNEFGLINSNFYLKLFPRILNYSISILRNTFVLKKIHKKFDFILFWDFLPDTFLPVYLSNLPKSKIIADIEELISSDPEASLFFKKFEVFFLRKFIVPKYFLSNISINLPFETKPFVLNGFFAESLEEEMLCNLLLKEFNTSKKLRIFYSSRFDNNRGVEEIIRLIKLDIDSQKFIFVICGFGSDLYFEQLNNLKKFHKGLEVYYQVERKILLGKLVNSDLSINLLKNDNFSKNSFPSKLIEYKCLGGAILTNIAYKEINDTSIIISYSAESIYIKLNELLKENNIKRDIKRNIIEVNKYSLLTKSNELESFLYGS